MHISGSSAVDTGGTAGLGEATVRRLHAAGGSLAQAAGPAGDHRGAPADVHTCFQSCEHGFL